MLTIEMLPNVCRHCAKHHLNKHQNQQEQQRLQHQHQRIERNGQCHDITNFQSMWLLLTTARKKFTKIRDPSHNNEHEHNENRTSNENAMSLMNVLAYHNNDQFLQCNNNTMIKSQPMHSIESARNDGSVLATKSSKMNDSSINDENTSLSNGALDGHPQSIRRFKTQVTPASSDETKRPNCVLSSTLRCKQCHYDKNDMDEMQTQAANPLVQARRFSLNVHDEKNPTSFSEKIDRLATNCSDLNRCIDKNGIDPNGSSRSVKTVSANYSNNHRRKHAYVNHRWPYAISSTMNFSHVLLLCIAFMAFSIRSAVVLADETPANSNQLNLTENGSK